MADAKVSRSSAGTRSKYHSHKIETKDGTFDSEGEYGRWIHLKKDQEIGLISDLRRQVTYELIPTQELQFPRKAQSGRQMEYKERRCTYKADFVYKDVKGHLVVEDFKGQLTEEYKIKRKLMLFVHGIQIKEVRNASGI